MATMRTAMAGKSGFDRRFVIWALVYYKGYTMKNIYLDYASLTPIDPRVSREVSAWNAKGALNPSAIHSLGVHAKKALESARTTVAEHIHAHPDEIVFTSGGTESNGLAIEGSLRAARRSGIERPHLVLSKVEHTSVIEVAHMLEGVGGDVTFVGVDKNGVVDLLELKKAIKPSTCLISIMTVNNELGTIQPIREIAKIVRDVRKSRGGNANYPLFHTDAAQALYEDLDMEKVGVDLITLDGNKVYGPRGTGALYIRRTTPIEPIMYGGGQERGLRSGTENIPGIMGLAKAFEISGKERVKEAKRLGELRDFFVRELRKLRPDIVVNGEGAPRSLHIVNVSIPGIDNEFFVLQLDAQGIFCSTKSSCLRDEDESYVLKAIGGDSKTSVRFSFGRWTKKGDLKPVLKAIKATFAK